MMTKELEAGIIKVLGDCGIDPVSKGYGYVKEAVAFLVEEEGYNTANN